MNVLSLRRLNEWTPRMKHRFYIITLSLFALAVTVRAQHFQEQPKSIKNDSIKTDFEEWLRNAPPHSAPFRSENEPLQKEVNKPLAPDLGDIARSRPLPPTTGIIDPRLLAQKEHPPVSVVIMTPKLKTDMQLAYQSHWLEESRKEQQGGGMMVGVNPLCLISVVVSKLFPSLANRKSKKERQREHLQQVLKNY